MPIYPIYGDAIVADIERSRSGERYILVFYLLNSNLLYNRREYLHVDLNKFKTLQNRIKYLENFPDTYGASVIPLFFLIFYFIIII